MNCCLTPFHSNCKAGLSSIAASPLPDPYFIFRSALELLRPLNAFHKLSNIKKRLLSKIESSKHCSLYRTPNIVRQFNSC